ncbi:hypothetical protein EW145_g556 [Phellinidium pouzarii]|uniref:EKC/KEOPS complex subunit GON7 n=1 Tax=Phellinidium pouzarii TaxID=167371 RepID=A0A4S4LNF8_9AGAM|nr:hypothetical protein EW145_g556 [Phellinidium pouzarii]
MMAKDLSVRYDLHPPSGTSVTTSMQTSKTHKFSVPSGTAQQEYYRSLRDAVVAAKEQIGADLTAWRDTIGTLENMKEPGKGKNEGVDDDAEDEDEE